MLLRSKSVIFYSPLLSAVDNRNFLFKDQTVGQTDRTTGKVLAFHAAKPGWIFGAPYALLSLPGKILKAQS